MSTQNLCLSKHGPHVRGLRNGCVSHATCVTNPRQGLNYLHLACRQFTRVPSEVFLPVVELVLVALLLEDLSELWRAAEEDGDPALLLLVDRLEDLVPVGAPRVGPRLQARDQVALRLQKEMVKLWQ